MSDIEQRLREAMDGVTPGPWVAKQTVIHGNEYGGWWLEGVDPNPEDAKYPERLVQISGSGGARSYTTRIIDRQIHDDNEANMKWFALCSPDNIGALLDTIASLRSKLEEAEGALTEAAAKCEAWAAESRAGGWSTHQVDANHKLADRLGRTLASLREADHA